MHVEFFFVCFPVLWEYHNKLDFFSHRKKSSGIRSGNRVSQQIRLSRPIQRSGNILLSTLRAISALCAGQSSCCNHILIKIRWFNKTSSNNICNIFLKNLHIFVHLNFLPKKWTNNIVISNNITPDIYPSWMLMYNTCRSQCVLPIMHIVCT